MQLAWSKYAEQDHAQYWQKVAWGMLNGAARHVYEEDQ
jgi:hypothetical protein